MTIETKFNVGSTVYLMRDNRIVEGEVEGIQLRVGRETPFGPTEEVIRRYDVKVRASVECMDENLLFSTARECADALLEDRE